MIESAYSFLSKGGVLMWPILGASVLALALFLERLWSLRAANVVPPRFVARIKSLLRQRQIDGARVLCQENESVVARVAEVALDRWTRGVDVREGVEERGRLESSRLDRFLEALGVIAAIEPLMGLLGTVTGMIKVFHNVSKRATEAGVDVGLLASGIWEALITTAFGLAIAIPVFIGYKYLISRVDRFILDLEEGSTELVDVLEEIGPAGASSRTHDARGSETTGGADNVSAGAEASEESAAASSGGAATDGGRST